MTCPPRIVTRLGAALAAPFLVHGCGDESTAPPPQVPTPATVTITPATATLIGLEATVRLIAEVRDQEARVMIGAAVSWTTDAEKVAEVDREGLVSAAGDGVATITATAGTARGTARVTVTEARARTALAAFHRALDGPNWVRDDNWLTDAPLGDWYGVDTDASGRVVGLNLPGRWDAETQQWSSHGLTGSIPPEIGHLSNLKRLNLIGNGLFGAIPPELGDLARLDSLELGANNLFGAIPPELGGLESLSFMWLSFNGLSGPIPPELGNLANLVSMEIASNRLSGPIPPELGKLAQLEGLGLSDNVLTGTVPPELGGLSLLQGLSLDWNRLTGLIPESFLGLDSLWSLGFGRNDGLCMPGTPDFEIWAAGLDRLAGPHCNARDRDALEALHQTSGGHRWNRSDGWLEGLALARWHGVEADSLGRVVTLDLSGNGLSGPFAHRVGELAQMTTLRISDNALSGPLPLTLARLSLTEFQWAGTAMCAPVEAYFREWLGGIETHTGTGAVCAPLSERDILALLHDATGGEDWVRADNWLTDRPLGTWHGVTVDDAGRVTRLDLSNNGLQGQVPPELVSLVRLASLDLSDNELSGPVPPRLILPALKLLDLSLNQLSGSIPPALAGLADLEVLNLSNNRLIGSLPAELADLAKLDSLMLGWNQLSGPIPPELGALASLNGLMVHGNELSGPIPPELGKLEDLEKLALHENDLSGEIPPELGALARLEWMALSSNGLVGLIPPELGRLTALKRLHLGRNRLSGSVPPELGALASLEGLYLARNARMAGALPTTLSNLAKLETLATVGTELCAPGDAGFQAWLERVHTRRIIPCAGHAKVAAYLTQSVQSRTFPVPLMAGRDALLRVFPTAGDGMGAAIPPVRARFHLDDREVHVEEIPGTSSPIPAEVDESSLAKSANALIPGSVVQPGLEVVIEVDPEGTLDAALGIQNRIPETGRLALDVRDMPVFELTLIPFVWSETGDSAIIAQVDSMARDPGGHPLLRDVRTMLPVVDLNVDSHEPVASSSNDAIALLRQTWAIRVLEGGTGHYKGLMSEPVVGASGVALRPGWESFSIPDAAVIAHELGHNMSLGHAPCNVSGDPSYPYPSGAIGAWGYDFEGGEAGNGALVDPSTPDVMSYCLESHWISDYHFANALRFRLFGIVPSPTAPTTPSLLLWGGADARGAPFLEPVFVVDAPPAPPVSTGLHRITGRSANGDALFSLSFDMSETADGDGGGVFAIVLPLEPGWRGSLADITLSGPGGTVSLDGDSDRPMAIVRSSRTGRVRAFLRGRAATSTTPSALADQAAGPPSELEVLFSRGIPDAAAWLR